MIGCLVLIGLILSAAIGKKAGALIYLFLVSLYYGLHNWSERSQAPQIEEGQPFAGYESLEDWRRAKRIEGWIAWSGTMILGLAVIFYFAW